MVLAEGDQVDRYVVERLLGAGGAAHVWQVRHQLLGKPFALKVLDQTQSAAQARLLQEGRAQALLEHANVLPVRDVFRVQGRLALLLPLVRGPSLRRLLSAATLPEAEALAMARAVLQGLAFIHQQGLVHCDIKPDNVLLDPGTGLVRPRIADFGLAQVSGTHGPGTGTPGYVAPEQLRPGTPVDERADVFSMGAVMFELFSGRQAFRARSIAAARDHQGPPDTAGLPAPVRAVIAAMLAAAPGDRPESCADVLAALPEADLAALGPNSTTGRVVQHLLLPPADSELTPSGSASAEVTSDTPHNLPAQTGPLLGRGEELVAATRALGEHARLLSVVGLGGTGKTRFAQHLGRVLLPHTPGGVWLVRAVQHLRRRGDALRDRPGPQGDPGWRARAAARRGPGPAGEGAADPGRRRGAP